MNAQNDTKKKIGASVVTIAASLALLTGLTFAWFTSSDTSEDNTVQAGTLDVQLNDGKQAALFTKADGVWAPGKFVAKNITVKNTGNLPLKYIFSVANVQDKAGLAKVLDVYLITNKKADQVKDSDLTKDNKLGTVQELSTWTKDDQKQPVLKVDESHTFTVVVKMQDNAGNKYQGVSGSADIVVKAAQTDTAATFE